VNVMVNWKIDNRARPMQERQALRFRLELHGSWATLYRRLLVVRAQPSACDWASGQEQRGSPQVARPSAVINT
jgi:hypothetical protein